MTTNNRKEMIMTEKFKAGDRVRIVEYDYVDRTDGKEYIRAYDRDGWMINQRVSDKVYIVAPTTVMPVSYMICGDGTPFYPLSEGENSHARKFYISEDKIELVEDEEVNEEVDKEIYFEPEYENDEKFNDDLNRTKAYSQIQLNISAIAKHIADICNEIGAINETIGKLLQNK
jgi:hypothetical protein